MRTCPQPMKARYATRQAAETGARRAGFAHNVDLRPYECACTWWHLTKGDVDVLPNPADAETADVQRLAALPDSDFREIVAADAVGEGEQPVRAALRHHVNLRRWKKHLTQLIGDVHGQLNNRVGDKSLEAHDWRKRVLGYQNSLELRRNEAKRLDADAHAEAARKGESRRRNAEVAAAAGASVSELRRQAGEVAIERLINAHGPEFCGYLADAYRGLGLEVPERITRRIPDDVIAGRADVTA